MLNRLKNPGTVVAIVSAVLLILTSLGIEIENEQVMTIVKAVCSIGIALGVMNNPETPGLDLPFNKKGN